MCLSLLFGKGSLRIEANSLFFYFPKEAMYLVQNKHSTHVCWASVPDDVVKSLGSGSISCPYQIPSKIPNSPHMLLSRSLSLYLDLIVITSRDKQGLLLMKVNASHRTWWEEGRQSTLES